MAPISLISELSQALLVSVETGNRSMMDACASELIYAFRDPFAGYGAALMQFHYFKGINLEMAPLREMHRRKREVRKLQKKLPITTPQKQTIELKTSHCYENGDKAAKHLYVIGNGFDLYHGAMSQYRSFREYLLRVSPEIVATFDLYFGPKSLQRSFRSPVGLLCCMRLPREYNRTIAEEAEWSKEHLWSDFEFGFVTYTDFSDETIVYT